MFNPKESLNVIRIIHLALMGGALVFASLAAFLTFSNNMTSEPVEVLNYLSPAYFFIVLAVHPIVFRATLKKEELASKNLQQKMMAFQTSHIIRMALLEGCALFAGVATLINGEILHEITVVLTLGVMFTKFPTPFLLESEIGLEQEERDQLIYSAQS